MESAFKLGDDEFKPYDKLTNENGTVNYDFVTKLDMKGKFITTPDRGSLVNTEEVSGYVIPAADAYAEAVWALQKKTREFTNCMGDNIIETVNRAVLSEAENPENKPLEEETKWIDQAFKSAVYSDSDLQAAFIKRWQDRFGKAKSAPTEVFLAKNADLDKEDVFTNSLLIKRTMVATFLALIFRDKHNEIQVEGVAVPVLGKYIDLCFNSKFDINDDLVMNNWSNVAVLGPGSTKWQKRWKSTLKWTEKFIGFKKAHEPVMNEYAPYFGWDRQVWNDQSGKIIFSDVSNATYVFEGENIKKWSHAALCNEDMLKNAIKGV